MRKTGLATRIANRLDKMEWAYNRFTDRVRFGKRPESDWMPPVDLGDDFQAWAPHVPEPKKSDKLSAFGWVTAVLVGLLLSAALGGSAEAKVYHLKPNVTLKTNKINGSQVRVVTAPARFLNATPGGPRFPLGRQQSMLPSVNGARHGAVAAIGGDFIRNGTVIHAYVHDGEVWTTGIKNGDVFNLAPGQSPWIDRGHLSLRLTFEGGFTQTIDKVNAEPAGAAAWTYRGDAATRPHLNYKLVSTHHKTAGTYTVATGQHLGVGDIGFTGVNRPPVGSTVTVKVTPDTEETFGGYPQVLRNGSIIQSNGNCENTGGPDGPFCANQPRQGVGISKDGTKVIIIEVDGHQKGWSRGVKLPEFGRLFRIYGAYNAINVDGGGSAVLWTRKKTRACERPGGTKVGCLVSRPVYKKDNPPTGERRLAQSIQVIP